MARDAQLKAIDNSRQLMQARPSKLNINDNALENHTTNGVKRLARTLTIVMRRRNLLGFDAESERQILNLNRRTYLVLKILKLSQQRKFRGALNALVQLLKQVVLMSFQSTYF